MESRRRDLVQMAGHFPRPMLKITGKSTPQFEELLNGEGKIVNI